MFFGSIDPNLHCFFAFRSFLFFLSSLPYGTKRQSLTFDCLTLVPPSLLPSWLLGTYVKYAFLYCPEPLHSEAWDRLTPIKTQSRSQSPRAFWSSKRSNEATRARVGMDCTISIETNKRQNGGRFKFRGMCFISQG